MSPIPPAVGGSHPGGGGGRVEVVSQVKLKAEGDASLLKEIEAERGRYLAAAGGAAYAIAD